MPTITVPDDVYQRLAARAAAAGTTVEALAEPALVQAAEVPTLSPSELPDEVWKKNCNVMIELFRVTMAGRLPPDFVLDDSRESIYEVCGGR